ncbi:MAG: pirin family protein [Gemmataceae bacterium]
MIQVRRSAERGHFDHGWLNTYHTFSFADYYDPDHMGFRSLRVINDDHVAAGMGFGMHAHRDMEIITYVLEGQLQHKDSLGHGAVLRPGELQHITAGSGIRHSEFNPSPSEPVHLYQIWLEPDQVGLKPGYDQKAFPLEGQQNGWQRVASPTGADGSLVIHQDAELLRSVLKSGETRDYPFKPGRHGWLQVLRGTVTANGEKLSAGDGLALSDERELQVAANDAAEVLLFDLS